LALSQIDVFIFGTLRNRWCSHFVLYMQQKMLICLESGIICFWETSCHFVLLFSVTLALNRSLGNFM